MFGAGARLNALLLVVVASAASASLVEGGASDATTPVAVDGPTLDSGDVLLSLMAARDLEPLPTGPFGFGAKSISGGAGEGDQRLGVDDSAAWQQRQEVKSDAAANAVLPAYCEPPNPCPIGYHAGDGCLEEFENSADFSRRFQSTQRCVCDQEHMFNCQQQNENNKVEEEEEEEEQQQDEQDATQPAEEEESDDELALEHLIAANSDNSENDEAAVAAATSGMIAKKFHEKRSVALEEPRRRKRSVGLASSMNMRKRARNVNPYLVGTPINSVQKKSGRNMW